MRSISLFVGLSTLVLCACGSPSTSGGTGGGSPFPPLPLIVTGGGSATGGGGAAAGGGGGGTGGGMATGGGSSTGGGTATGGGHGTGGGGGATCDAIVVPSNPSQFSRYRKTANDEGTVGVRSWNGASGYNFLMTWVDWELAPNPVAFPLVGTVTSGRTSGAVFMLYLESCASDGTACQTRYGIYDGTITIEGAARAPVGSFAANHGAVRLQEIVGSQYVLPGRCRSAPALHWSSTQVCTANGNACSLDSDCCVNACTSGICGVAPVCKADGASCSSTSECCNSSCNSGVCGGPTCKADGVSCTSSSQCCTSSCSSGVCGGPTCKADGLSCTSSSQCCTSSCSSGVCGGPTCKADGLSCTSSSQCCVSNCISGVCGGPTCKDDGASCTSSSQCCVSNCVGGVCGGSSGGCDPVNDVGCSSPNACILLSSESTVCALPGVRNEGSTCSASNPCAASLGCFAGVCKRICRRSNDEGCSSWQTCAGVSGWGTYGVCN